MPIVQVRATQESHYLTAPFPPTPNMVRVLQEWQKPEWNSELLVYPSGYTGDVKPDSWPSTSAYLLMVDKSGERANMLATSSLLDQKTLAELIPELHKAAPGAIRDLGSLAIIDRKNPTAFVTSALGGGRLAIAGLVLYTTPNELASLKTLFPETPVEMPHEG